jgi:NAD(P)-dependent dehydrogenase (short-subunit alcohol dehydrogenase family)
MQKQKILIVGGSSGMGLAAAQLMANQGYEIAIASRSKAKLAAAAKSIGQAEIHELDLRDEGAVAQFFKTFPAFDHLVLTAADFTMGPFLTLDTAEARQFFDSKFWGQYHAVKHAAPKIKPGGSITLFSGIASDKPTQGLSCASAINGAIESLTQTLAVELAPLRVNAISPGVIVTPVWNDMPEKERTAYFQKAGARLPVKAVGQSEDIAQAVRFLIECPFVTGEILHCDGGGRLI